jgi:hypothetical protein
MNPKQALERAVYAWLTGRGTLTNIASTSIYKGIDNGVAIDTEDTNTQPQDKAHPSITLEAEGLHEEAVFQTKVYRGNFMVTVESDAQNTTDETFNTICEEAFGVFDIQQLATNISAANDRISRCFSLGSFRTVTR